MQDYSYLQYRTRAEDATVQGKEKVYFTCYPSDFDLYFNEICDEIFQTQNCAIFYDPDLTVLRKEETLESELSGMQLFVIPITTKFLTKENRALSLEFDFAVRHHIPILPLMRENGLEELFNKKCGDLQFLNKYDTDLTAIPYPEKLEKFLSSVLLGDELAQKVREAFDAYIFLSYRKKDRNQAQELMHRIHQNDFCRDIAIWYDEFLVPGEDFNKTIEEHLRLSKLFALVVTPSLLEPNAKGEANYVQKEEYPAAIRSGKPVLPIEMKETDRAALEEQFENIPKSISKENIPLRNALYASLHTLLQKRDDPQNSNDPLHLYLIGLAYLSGIDVEVNRPRAIEMLTKAADMKLPEAIRKLVSIYRLEKEYRIAISWMEKLVKIFEMEYEKEQTLQSARAWFHAQWTYGDYIYELQQISWAKEAYTTLLTIVEEISAQHDFKREFSICYGKLGDLAKMEGDFAAARNYYYQCLHLCIQSALPLEETAPIEAWRDLSVIYNSLGDLAKEEEDLVSAKAHYQQCLEVRTLLAEETETPQAQRDLSYSYDRLGDLAEKEGDLDTARDYYLKGLKIDERLAKEHGTPQAKSDLSLSYSNLGDLAQANGDLVTANEYYQKCLMLCIQLAEETETVDARKALAVIYGKLSSLSQVKGDFATAKSYIQKTLEIYQQLAADTNTVWAWRSLSLSYRTFGILLEEEKDVKAAKNYYQQSLKLAEQLIQKSNAPEAQRDLAACYIDLGDIAKEEEDFSAAKEYYQNSLYIIERIGTEAQTVEAQRDLSVCYGKLGDIAKEKGDLTAAKNYYQRCLKIDEKLAETTGTPNAQRDLSADYSKLGDTSEAEGNPAAAKEYYQKSLKIDEQLAEETEMIDDYDNLAVSYYKLGCLGEKEYAQKAYDIWAHLANHHPTVERFAECRDIVAEYLI